MGNHSRLVSHSSQFLQLIVDHVMLLLNEHLQGNLSPIKCLQLLLLIAVCSFIMNFCSDNQTKEHLIRQVWRTDHCLYTEEQITTNLHRHVSSSTTATTSTLNKLTTRWNDLPVPSPQEGRIIRTRGHSGSEWLTEVPLKSSPQGVIDSLPHLPVLF